MSKFKKVGKVYGNLTVKEYLGNLYYKCYCKCGRYCIVKTTELRNDGKGVERCEVCRKEKVNNPPLKGEKEGEIFGEVKVLKYLGNKNYLCHCNRCGSNFITRSYNLRGGRRGIKTCGCHVIHYSKDETFFEEIDTEEKAYFLGVIASDGHINLKDNNVKLTLQLLDYDLVAKFAKALQYNGPILVKDIETVLPNGKKCKSKIAQVTICSQKLVASLIKMGFDNRKTYNLNFDFSFIPKQFIRDFIRGYWDGDGTCNITRGPSGKISYHALCIGNTIMMKKLKEIIEREILGIKIKISTPIKERPWTSVIEVVGKEWFEKFINYLYQNAKVYLQRKYISYKENIVILDMMRSKNIKSYKNIPIEDKKKLYQIKKYKKFLTITNSNDYPSGVQIE